MRRISESSFGLGPLEPLLADPTVDEVIVNGAGVMGRSGSSDTAGSSRRRSSFSSDDELRHTIERILAPLGRRVDESEPMVDARLPDGSRVNVVLPPLAVDGPAMTIRRFRRIALTAEELVACGT